MLQSFKKLAAAAMLLLAAFGCKKEDKMPAPQNATKEITTMAKAWLAAQQAALVKSGGGMQFDPAGRINWSSPITGTDGHTQFIPIATDSKQMAKYLKVSRDGSGAITGGNYVYLYPTMYKQADAYLLEGKKIPADFSGTLLEYGLNNQLLSSKVYEKGNAVAGKTAKLALKPAANGKGGTATPNLLGGNDQARVVCYEYYLQTFVNGLLVTEVYLYTMCYGTPDATLETEGGGGGMVDESAALIAEFNNYTKSISTPATATTDVTTPDPDPISFTHTWNVVEGAIVPWRVEATTRIDYLHNKYYDLQLNAIEHRYNIVQLKTFNTQYVGTNIVANTTWTETAVRDDILNNNTAQAYGKSSVFGKIRHRMIVPPGVTMPLVPDFEQNVGNYCTTTPK